MCPRIVKETSLLNIHALCNECVPLTFQTRTNPRVLKRILGKDSHIVPQIHAGLSFIICMYLCSSLSFACDIYAYQ